MNSSAGFSLVELMIVVAILSVLSLGATLAIGMRDRNAGSDATVLRQTYIALRDEAILSKAPRALEISDRSLTRMTRSAEGEWQAEGHEISLDGTAFATRGYGAETTSAGDLRVVLLTDGRSSAFEVRLSQGKNLWHCAADGWGTLTCDASR